MEFVKHSRWKYQRSEKVSGKHENVNFSEKQPKENNQKMCGIDRM